MVHTITAAYLPIVGKWALTYIIEETPQEWVIFDSHVDLVQHIETLLETSIEHARKPPFES